jgi:ATP-dependent DNA helicase 2 subunit 1
MFVVTNVPVPSSSPSYLHRKTNKTTDILATETGEIIPPERIHRFIEFGGERVSISKQELSRIKKDSNAHPKKASLILLGFKPMSSIPRIHQYPLIDRSLFAYPNDDLVKGSRVAFATLHAAMLRKNVLGIGELLQRINATSRMVAIVPQEEELSEDGMIQEVPPGFLLIPLAYEDDIRAIPETPETGDYEADSELVSAAEGFMTKLRLENVVIGESFENPALKVFWNYMESVALGTLLGENDPDEDDTTWDVDAILSVCGGEIETFKQLLPEDEVIVKERKRKVTTVRADETNIDWFHEYEENTFEDLTVEELKAYCRSQGEKVGGRKVDLIQRVKDHIRSRIDDLPSKHTNQTLENV